MASTDVSIADDSYQMDIPSLHLYERLNKVAMAMPEAHEKLCYGTPAFHIEKKLFVRLKEDWTTIALYCTDRDEWMAKNGDIFFITDHYKKLSHVVG